MDELQENALKEGVWGKENAVALLKNWKNKEKIKIICHRGKEFEREVFLKENNSSSWKLKRRI